VLFAYAIYANYSFVYAYLSGNVLTGPTAQYCWQP